MHGHLKVKFVCISSSCTPFCTDFNGTWNSSRDFPKNTHTEFHENTSNGSRFVPCGQTDRYSEANKSLFAVLWRHLKVAEFWSVLRVAIRFWYVQGSQGKTFAENFCCSGRKLRWRPLCASVCSERVQEQEMLKELFVQEGTAQTGVK